MEDLSKLMQFSVLKDPETLNDKHAWHQAWRKIEIGKPATFGGVFGKQENSEITYEQFVTSRPPAVPDNTRIIAVCGIDEPNASPMKDGWMVSDFLAMYQLFKGLTPHQRWIHSLNFPRLLEKHRAYVHGNPYKTRKIVLDKQMYESGAALDPCFTREHSEDICEIFKDHLRDQCEAAELSGDQNILIMLFGHGIKMRKIPAHIKQDDPEWKKYTYKLQFGTGAALSLTELMRQLNVGKKVQVMLITTACYSGGWVCHPELNVSAMTTASYEKKSRSWRYSGSIGQHCGSMGVSALIEKLTYDHHTKLSLKGDLEDDYEPTDEKLDSMAEFVRTVSTTLLSIDRRAYTHEFTFKVQDDNWSASAWPANTIPCEELLKRWNELQPYAADTTLHIGDPLNRDPNVPQEARDEYQRLEAQFLAGEIPGRKADKIDFDKEGSMTKKRKVISVFGGTIHSYTNLLKSLAAEYMASNPGCDDLAPNTSLSGTIRELHAGEITDFQILNGLHVELQYRLEVTYLADVFLQYIGVGAPEGRKCAEVDTDDFFLNAKYDKNAKKEASEWLFENEHEFLFPCPSSYSNNRSYGRMQPFTKGPDYMLAAVTFAWNKFDKKQAAIKFKQLRDAHECDIEALKKFVKDIGPVKSKRQKVFESFGRKLRDLSPVKSIHRNRG